MLMTTLDLLCLTILVYTTEVLTSLTWVGFMKLLVERFTPVYQKKYMREWTCYK
jgi:uncharacterized membrane protein